MQFDRAMTFLLEGHSIRRACWVHPDRKEALRFPPKTGDTVLISKEIIRRGNEFAISGEEALYCRPQSFLRRLLLGSEDLGADDWEVSPASPEALPSTKGLAAAFPFQTEEAKER